MKVREGEKGISIYTNFQSVKSFVSPSEQTGQSWTNFS